jgi:putative PEP-CTERM system histidine kinase
MRVGLPNVGNEISVADPFALALADGDWRVWKLDHERVSGRDRASLPDWLQTLSAAWLLVPLLNREQLVGFVILGHPRVPRTITREDEELLRIVAQQTASYLAAERATQALEEAGRFQEVSQRLSFLAHDLRNVANELSLSLANARKHIGNPRFHPDLLATMEDSVSGMHRLLSHIRSQRAGQTVNATQLVDMAELVKHFAAPLPDEGPKLSIEVSRESPCFVAADRDQLQAVIGHLIRNALEAVPDTGRVTVRLRCDNEGALLEVEDNGQGMSADFLRERLHHPFRSTKSSGYGLGLYECRKVAISLGGRLDMRSEPGQGTVGRLSLPLADADPTLTGTGGAGGS